MSAAMDTLDVFFKKYAFKDTGSGVEDPGVEGYGGQMPSYYFYVKGLLACQYGAIAGSTHCQDYLEDVYCRVFYRNNTGSDVTVTYNKIDYTLVNGTAYAFHPKDYEFIAEKLAEDGVVLAKVNLAAWLISGDAGVIFLS